MQSSVHSVRNVQVSSWVAKLVTTVTDVTWSIQPISAKISCMSSPCGTCKYYLLCSIAFAQASWSQALITVITGLWYGSPRTPIRTPRVYDGSSGKDSGESAATRSSERGVEATTTSIVESARKVPQKRSRLQIKNSCSPRAIGKFLICKALS